MKPLYLKNSVTSYIHSKRLLNSFDSMSIEDLDRMRLTKLKQLVNYAWTYVPFYRKLWASNNISPDDIHLISDFEKLPTIDRNDIIANCDGFIPNGYNRNRLSRITTGGTSGMPMYFYIDNYKARGKEIAYVGHINRKCFGCGFFERELLLRGDRIVNDKDLENKKFWRYSIVRHALLMSSFHITQENLPYYVAKLREYAPTVIKAYPSSLWALCYLLKRNDVGPLKSLKRVICSSENISDSLRSLVRETLGVEIYSFYGHSEKCVIAFQGNEGKMLFHPLYGYTEFISDKGEIVSQPGEIAEVVVTGFDHEYFPLIRYRTNDLIEIGTPQGLFDKTANKIIGRGEDFLYDKNYNKIIFTNSDEPFWKVKGIDAYQYIQDIPGKISVSLKVNSDFTNESEHNILLGMEEIFHGFEIEFCYVDDIPKTQRGKFKYLIQNIKY